MSKFKVGDKVTMADGHDGTVIDVEGCQDHDNCGSVVVEGDDGYQGRWKPNDLTPIAEPSASPEPKPYYDVDGITIYHARCEDVLPSIDPASVDLLLTDPPYGINLDTRFGTRTRNAKPRAHSKSIDRGGVPARSIDHPRVYGDDKPFDPTPLLAYRRAVMFGANHFASRLPDSGSWIVWDRESGGSDTADAELAWTNLGGTVRTFRHLWNGVCRATEIGSHVHPTQKPVALMRWIVDKWTDPGDLVLDPYMGSGPVARACADLGRRYIGIEIVEDYCRVAVERLAQQTLDLGGTA